MEELICTLRSAGFPESECSHVRERYAGDIDGLSLFVLIYRAMFDDRHEYID